MVDVETTPPGPPDGWLIAPLQYVVMSNGDRSIDQAIADRLRGRGHTARHAGWNFNGLVWFDNDRWHERVSVYGVPVATFSAGTLDELMRVVNDEYGWE